MTSRALAKAAHYLVRDPIEKPSLGLLLRRLRQLLSERANGRTDEPLARGISAMKSVLGFPPFKIMDAAALAAALAKLRQRGWELLPWRLPAVRGPRFVKLVSAIARARIEGLDQAIGRIVRKFFV